MSTTKTLATGIVIAGTLGMTNQSDASTRQGDDLVRDRLGVAAADGEASASVDTILLPPDAPREYIEDPDATTIEEAVLASGLHGGQLIDALRVAPGPFNDASIAAGTQQLEIHAEYHDPSVDELHHALTAGLEEDLTVRFTDIDPAALAEAVLGTAPHKAHIFVYDDINTPVIEEMVLASGFHQEPTTTIVKDDLDTAALEEVLLASGLHIQLLEDKL